MGLFKHLNDQNIMFTKHGEYKYKLVLSVESLNDDILITYLDNTTKQKLKIKESNLDKYIFIEKTKNLFYKRYVKVNPKTLLGEMDTGDAGIGGTSDSQFSSDFYAPNDARNIFGGATPPMIRRNKITDMLTSKKKKKKKSKKARSGKKSKK